MIAVVQLDIFSNNNYAFQEQWKKLDFLQCFFFSFGLVFSIRAQRLDELPVLKSDTCLQNFITFYKSKVSENCSWSSLAKTLLEDDLKSVLFVIPEQS